MVEITDGVKEGDTLLISQFRLGDKKDVSSPFGPPKAPNTRGSGKRQ
jgi:hypothetical protein